MRPMPPPQPPFWHGHYAESNAQMHPGLSSAQTLEMLLKANSILVT